MLSLYYHFDYSIMSMISMSHRHPFELVFWTCILSLNYFDLVFWAWIILILYFELIFWACILNLNYFDLVFWSKIIFQLDFDLKSSLKSTLPNETSNQKAVWQKCNDYLVIEQMMNIMIIQNESNSYIVKCLVIH